MEPVEVISFYYYPEDNRMFDQDGKIFTDIFRIISPYRFNFLKQVGGTEYIRRRDVIIEFVFPIPGEDDEDY